MAKALNKNGTPVELYIYEDELHGFVDNRNAVDPNLYFVDFYTTFSSMRLRAVAAAASAAGMNVI